MATESAPFPTTGSTIETQGSSTESGMPGGEPTMAETAERARGSDMLQRVVQGAHETIDRLADRAAPAVDKLQDSMVGASDRMSAGADQMREMSAEWADSMRSTVRENPLAAVGVALALGMLIARLTR